MGRNSKRRRKYIRFEEGIWILLSVAIIFSAQVVYVSIMTLRWIILMRGNRGLASVISFFEVLIYVYALAIVVTDLHNPYKLVVYALGYAVGSWVGVRVEERLAYGFSVIQVVTRPESKLPEGLRERGFGVTSWPGYGRETERIVALVLCRRRHVPKLQQIIDTLDPSAFMLHIEPKGLRGGFWLKRLV